MGENPSIILTWARTTGGLLATKTITREGSVFDEKPDGVDDEKPYNVKEKPYDNAKYFTFTRWEYANWGGFAAALRRAARDRHSFLIRGELAPGISYNSKVRRISKEGDPELTIVGPPRWWGVFDVDGAPVPRGLTFPAALLHYRDTMMPPELRGVRMVATATSNTNWPPTKLRARIYFLFARPTENSELIQYTRTLAERLPRLALDHRIGEPGRAIYTARPIFVRCQDWVPESEWVVVLDGERGHVDLDHVGTFVPAKATIYTPACNSDGPGGWFKSPPAAPPAVDDPYREALAGCEDALPLSILTPFGDRCLDEAFDRIIEAKPNDRHFTVNREAFNIGQRVAEGSIPYRFPTGWLIGDVLMLAADKMKFNDKYSPNELREKIAVGLSEGVARPRDPWSADDE
jgi:hypothetical protein